MDGVSGGDGYMNNHTHYKQYWVSNNVDVSSENSFINSLTLYQCIHSSNFK